MERLSIYYLVMYHTGDTAAVVYRVLRYKLQDDHQSRVPLHRPCCTLKLRYALVTVYHKLRVTRAQ